MKPQKLHLSQSSWYPRCFFWAPDPCSQACQASNHLTAMPGYTTGSRPRMYWMNWMFHPKLSCHMSWQALSIFPSIKASSHGSRDLHCNKCSVMLSPSAPSGFPGFTIGIIAPICSIHAVRTLSYHHNRLVSCLKKRSKEQKIGIFWKGKQLPATR